jgi:hypothetical protein
VKLRSEVAVRSALVVLCSGMMGTAVVTSGEAHAPVTIAAATTL